MVYPPLPESFIFGVATADHQVEAYEPAFKDVRDAWDEQRNLQLRERATDFWNRYPEDIELARKMGCKAFRFSISWARVEPKPGQFNEKALAHYQQLTETILAAGMQPVLTLHHFTWPLHIESRGGMISDEFPSWFAQYAEVVASRFGSLVTYWITFNELNQLVYGYFKAGDYFMPPGLPPNTPISEQMDKVRRLIRNLFEAHTRARAVIQKHHPAAKVGVNPWLLGLPVWARWFVNWKVSRLREENWEKQGKRFTEQSLLWERKVDVVVANVTVTAERAQQIDFSEIYYVDGLNLLVKTGSPIQTPQDLVGKIVAAVKSSRAASAIFTLLPGVEDKVVDRHAEAVKLLAEDKVAAVLADSSTLQGIADLSGGQYQLLGENLTKEPYAVAVGKGNPSLLDAVDIAVRRFRDGGKWAESYQKYLPRRTIPLLPNVPTRVTLANLQDGGSEHGEKPLPLAEEGTWLRRIQDRGYLIAGVKDNVLGFGYQDPQTGEFNGLEIDLAKEIALTIFSDRDKIQFYSVTTQQRLPYLRSPCQIFDPLLRGFSTLSTIFNSNWWHLGMAGKLPEFLCPAGCVDQQDFVGFDYYWGVNTFHLNKLEQLLNALRGDSQNSPVWPEGFYALIKEHAKLFPDKEIMIIENGCVPEADGIFRQEYLRRHIEQIQRACQEGVNIVAYLCWSITTNREWGLKLSPKSDFGLYKIDLDNDYNLTRIETEDVAVYRKIVQQLTALPLRTNH
jgi:beta-glucosidase/6-phospho-beta-glucosidase/beta-galactosidase/ABC-type amino acid transport substrate-binding protein